MTDPAPTRLVTGAAGVRLRLADGRELVDGMSSWWAAIHGYNHPASTRRSPRRPPTFAHVMFGGLTHEPAIRLAQRLVELTPAGLEHVFLADSGSVSVEVALKMVAAVPARRRPARADPDADRPRRLPRRHVRLHERVRPGGRHALDVRRRAPPAGLRRPAARRPRTASPPGRSRSRRSPPRTPTSWPGIIVEPLLQGAGGHARLPRRVPRGDARRRGPARAGAGLRRDRDRLRPHRHAVRRRGGRRHPRHHVRGQGADRRLPDARRGAVHAADRRRARPHSESGVLMHGPTYMGNPLACAVALATLDLLAADDWRAQVAGVERGPGVRARRGPAPAGRGRRAHDRGGRRRPARPPGRRRQGHRGGASSRACGCGRSAT